MNNVERVKEITDSSTRNSDDQEALGRFFAPGFEHWANGRRSDLKGYAAHLGGYRTRYGSFRVPAWDELFAADDRVVAACVLEAKTKGGSVERVPVIAIWRFRDGKVIPLREVDAPPAQRLC